MKAIRWKVGVIFLTLFIFLAACGSIWDLNLAGGEKAIVEYVEITSIGFDQTKYLAVVTGTLPDGCSKVGRNVQDINGDTIEVTLYIRSGEGTCAAPFTTPFEETFSLDIDDLPSGIYNVEVNGVIAEGSLTKGSP